MTAIHGHGSLLVVLNLPSSSPAPSPDPMPKAERGFCGGGFYRMAKTCCKGYVGEKCKRRVLTDSNFQSGTIVAFLSLLSLPPVSSCNL